MRRFGRSVPLLQRRLKEYQARLAALNPRPKACPRGPQRALQLSQLLDLADFFKDVVLARNMYFIEPTFVRSLTAAHRLSFAEVAGPAVVQWFVSHCWSHPFADTLQSLERHAFEYAVAAGQSTRDTAYWICTFSINRYAIEEELGDGHGRECSFFLALMDPNCRGTCMVVCEKLLPLRRSWCLFEILQTQVRANRQSQGFEGLLFCTKTGVFNHGKASPEMIWEIASAAPGVNLHEATASFPADKVMIDRSAMDSMGDFDSINSVLRRAVKDASDASRRATKRNFRTGPFAMAP